MVTDFDAVRDELYRDILEKKLRIAMADEFDRLQRSAQIDNFLSSTSQPGAETIEAVRQMANPNGGARAVASRKSLAVLQPTFARGGAIKTKAAFATAQRVVGRTQCPVRIVLKKRGLPEHIGTRENR